MNLLQQKGQYTMKKRVSSYSSFWMTVISCALLIACIVLYIITGLQSAAANSKRSDLVKYSDMYASAYLYSQSELSTFANTENAEHYNNYNNAVSETGTMQGARKVLDEIGLETQEQEVLDEFDSVYSEYIEPVNESAIEQMVSNSDFSSGKKALADSDYLNYSSYCYTCLSTLSDSVYDRMTETLDNIDTRNQIVMICLIILSLIFVFMLIFTQLRIRKISRLLEAADSEEDSSEQEE